MEGVPDGERKGCRCEDSAGCRGAPGCAESVDLACSLASPLRPPPPPDPASETPRPPTPGCRTAPLGFCWRSGASVAMCSAWSPRACDHFRGVRVSPQHSSKPELRKHSVGPQPLPHPGSRFQLASLWGGGGGSLQPLRPLCPLGTLRWTCTPLAQLHFFSVVVCDFDMCKLCLLCPLCPAPPPPRPLIPCLHLCAHRRSPLWGASTSHGAQKPFQKEGCTCGVPTPLVPLGTSCPPPRSTPRPLIACTPSPPPPPCHPYTLTL